MPATRRKKSRRTAPRKAASGGNGRAKKSASAARTPRKRRATAASLAASQRDISVSEFFAKNRHLLGFDSPQKALLTAVKEAVDNALDACEEAGILPELWVHVDQTAERRYRIGVQDNGPGILKKQIPNIFGKLLYGSKFHRLRMSRGQQGIGISAAGMYGVLTTGKPVKILSKVSKRKPIHYYEIQINTKANKPEILNGRGDGVDIPPGDKGARYLDKHGIEWEEVTNGTRVTIELEARYQRGRTSVDDYLEQTCIANPHVTLHYTAPDGQEKVYERSAEVLPKEPKEIKPHPYGIELGRLIAMLKDTSAPTLSQFLTSSFSKVSPAVARRICQAADVSTRANTKRIGRSEADALYQAIQKTKIHAPSTDCISPIGEELLLKGLHHIVPGEFYAAATRPPAVYRGNPFQIEVALAYGGAATVRKVTSEELTELLSQSDARTVRQFIATTFQGVGPEGAARLMEESNLGARKSPAKLKPKEIASLYDALQNVSLDEGQTMNVLRYANRVPLQFRQGGCAITQTIMKTSWRSYGLSQSRGNLPSGPVTVLVHMASVWVPFTSESKEAVASYPEIEKELRLGLQAVGRKLGMYLRRRQRVKQEGERRNVFLRYLGEVATGVSKINGTNRDQLYEQLLKVATRKTSEADARYNDRGQRVEDESEIDYGDNVIVVGAEP